MLKNILLLFFLSIYLNNNAQEWFNPIKDYKSRYNSYDVHLKGKVKSILQEETDYLYIRNTLPEIYHSKKKVIFNKLKKITQEYNYFNKKAFLSKENEYLNDTLLVYSKEQYRIFNNKILTKRIFSIEEKYTYNNNQQLITKYIKSTRLKDFIISIKNHYKNNLLIKSERLNNHIDVDYYITCKGDGSSEKDYIIDYRYNKNQQLIEKKQYESNLAWIDKKHVREIGGEYKYPFKLKRIKKYSYKKNKLVEILYITKSNKKDYLKRRVITYDKKNRILENYVIDKNINGSFYEYQIVNDSIKRIYGGRIFTKFNAKTRLKKTNQIYEFYNDKSLIVFEYECDEDTKEYYDIHKNLIKAIEFGKVTYQCNYKYDKFDNWIEVIEFENGKIDKKVFRKIEYY